MSEMVFVSRVVFAGMRFEEVVAGRELEGHASGRPERIHFKFRITNSIDWLGANFI